MAIFMKFRQKNVIPGSRARAKRILGWILSLALVIGLLPSAFVFAEYARDTGGGWSAASDGGAPGNGEYGAGVAESDATGGIIAESGAPENDDGAAAESGAPDISDGAEAEDSAAEAGEAAPEVLMDGQPVEQSEELPEEQPVEQPVEQPEEQPVEQPEEQPVEQSEEQQEELPVEQPAEGLANEQPVEQQEEQPAEGLADEQPEALPEEPPAEGLADEQPEEQDPAPISARLNAQPKKAIYLLPGFSASQMYNSNGVTLWIGPGLLTDFARYSLTGQSDMQNGESGFGAKAITDRNRDKYGLLSLYKTWVTGIIDNLEASGLGGAYSVEFFSFNFLQDINITARELAADIDAKGYESVILVAHSNGGNLASSFVSQFPEKKSMIEKSIMIGVPMMGSYLIMMPVETGTLYTYDGTPLSSVMEAGYEFILKPISKKYVQGYHKNNANCYQLMPGPDYLNRVPLMYHTPSGTRAITDPNEYYNIIAKSPNMNPRLVNGGSMSTKYFYEETLKNDVFRLWDGVDVTMVGCDYGLLTPYNAVYYQSGGKSLFGGMLYNREGDYGAPDFSTTGEGRFPYVNIPYAHHVMIASDERALEVINDLIAGRPVKDYTGTLPGGALYASMIKRAVGMSDMIRVEIKSSDPLMPNPINRGIALKVCDKKGNVVAFSDGEFQTGFVLNNFVFNSWETADNATNLLCYIPKEGYTLEVFTGRLNVLSSDITVYTETLDRSGAILTRNGYRLTGANLLTASVFTLDPSKSMAPAPRIGAKLNALSADVYRQNWQFASETLTLNPNETAIPAVAGADAPSMVAGEYTWHSSDTGIAAVSPEGRITALAPGAAVITAAAQDGSYKTESVNVAVVP